MKNIFLSGGMPRSGSTWLYNVIRLILNESKKYNSVMPGWVDDINITPNKAKFFLIKTHTYNTLLINKAKYIYYSFRDVREVLISANKKFNQTPSLVAVDRYIKQYYLWSKISTYNMKYESMLDDKEKCIADIANTLNINVNAASILSELNCLKYDSAGEINGKYNMLNLFHKNHITNTIKSDWINDLDKKLVIDIEHKYKQWFIENNYKLYYI